MAEAPFVNPDGRIVRFAGKPGDKWTDWYEEFVDGSWVIPETPIFPSDAFDDSRPLTPEELAMVEKSGV